MITSIKEQLTSLFDEMTAKDMKYSKTEFPKTFDRIYKRYETAFQMIDELYEKTDTPNLYIQEIASCIPDHIEQKMDLNQSKRKLESIFVDYNMKLVIFILPMFNYTNSEAGKQISERLVNIWNERFHTNVQNTGYEQIQKGFRERLCYITTAVCQSLQKADDCYELLTLRDYRDHYLMQEGNAEELVKEYYNIAPTIVKHLNRQEDATRIYQDIWDRYLSPCLQLIEKEELEECKNLYTDMVNNLKKEYLHQTTRRMENEQRFQN